MSKRKRSEACTNCGKGPIWERTHNSDLWVHENNIQECAGLDGSWAYPVRQEPFDTDVCPEEEIDEWWLAK